MFYVIFAKVVVQNAKPQVILTLQLPRYHKLRAERNFTGQIVYTRAFLYAGYLLLYQFFDHPARIAVSDQCESNLV